jgi:predicted ATPase/transcriptional regulator with XRE-family HTH domain
VNDWSGARIANAPSRHAHPHHPASLCVARWPAPFAPMTVWSSDTQNVRISAAPERGPLFGAMLRRYRLAAGLSQEALAQRAGLSARGISDLERGVRRSPQRETVRRLVAALDLTAADVPSLEATIDRRRGLREDGASGRAALRQTMPADLPRSTAMPTDTLQRSVESWPPGPGDLTLALTSFVGREREIQEVRALLTTARLVTLAGPGGCGKTRLALQVAQAVAAELQADRCALRPPSSQRTDRSTGPADVWVVRLASVMNPALVASEVATTLGVREESGRPLPDTLAECLRRRSAWLVLDNCEHLLHACYALIERLLQACPHLHVLVTSREVLGVPGEVQYLVSPLDCPPEPEPDRRVTPEDVSEYAAVRLFVDRAQAISPGFELTDANAPAIGALCRRLDGLPLALELAAARIKLLPVGELLARLDDPFTILSGSQRAALPQHRTLQATLDWSYGLLSEPEQRLLDRVSVFVGGFSLPAAETVGVDPGEPSADVLQVLAGLVDQSMVVAEERGSRARYRLLETIRAYALTHLAASGEAEIVLQRHAAYFLGLAEQAETRLQHGEQLTWLDLLDAEYDNLRAVLVRCLERARPGAASLAAVAPGRSDLPIEGAAPAHRHQAASALRLAGDLTWYWWLRGCAGEGQRWLEAALTAAPDAPSNLRARASQGAGILATYQGDGTRSLQWLHQAHELYQGLGDPNGVAWTEVWLGFALGNVQGDPTSGIAMIEHALPTLQALGDHWRVALGLWGVGVNALSAGSVGRAERALEESLTLFRRSGDRPSAGWAMLLASNLAQARGDFARADELLTLVDETMTDFRERMGLAFVQRGRGRLAQRQGDLDRATACYRASLELASRVGDRGAIVGLLFRLAVVARDLGDDDRSTRLLGATRTLLDALGLRPAALFVLEAAPDGDEAALADQLGRGALPPSWATGQALSLDEAIAYALNPSA